jgi:formylglycine-generating enzyme required for sulfatase activity
MKRRFARILALAAILFGAPAVQDHLNAQPLTPEAERALKPLTSFRECTFGCPEMVVLPAGEFVMGGGLEEQLTGCSSAPCVRRHSEERPQHKVVFARPFAVSKFHVTGKEWAECYLHGGCPNLGGQRSGTETNPVIGMSWFDAQAYVTWLSRLPGDVTDC